MENELGFIMTRHVNSEKTNLYWNRSVQLLRIHYPNSPIVIIDDNSNLHFVHANQEYENVTIIQSEYPKRGELLPFVYFLKYKWFPKAVIIHDGLFIHEHIPFEILNLPVLPLWHHPYDHENLNNILRIASHLKNNVPLKQRLQKGKELLQGFRAKLPSVPPSFNLCFGGQCFIQLSFLESLEQKYALTNMLGPIQCRKDRCALERILGVLFHAEFPELIQHKSLFGGIMEHYRSFKYTYDDYMRDYQSQIIRQPVIKVWTGR
jgi:hypothetical protein